MHWPNQLESVALLKNLRATFEEKLGDGPDLDRIASCDRGYGSEGYGRYIARKMNDTYLSGKKKGVNAVSIHDYCGILEELPFEDSLHFYPQILRYFAEDDGTSDLVESQFAMNYSFCARKKLLEKLGLEDVIIKSVYCALCRQCERVQLVWNINNIADGGYDLLNGHFIYSIMSSFLKHNVFTAAIEKFVSDLSKKLVYGEPAVTPILPSPAGSSEYKASLLYLCLCDSFLFYGDFEHHSKSELPVAPGIDVYEDPDWPVTDIDKERMGSISKILLDRKLLADHVRYLQEKHDSEPVRLFVDWIMESIRRYEGSPEELAADAWDAVELRDLTPVAEWLARQPGEKTTVHLPAERPVKTSEDAIVAEGGIVYFDPDRKTFVECSSNAQAALVALLAKMGLGGDVSVPKAEADCEAARKICEDRWPSILEHLKRLSRRHAGKEKLKQQVYDTLLRWYIFGKE